MNRRVFIAAGTALALGSLPLGAAAQTSGKLYRIGILETLPAERNRANLDALLRGLRERGYVEGQNLQIEYRSADGLTDRFPGLAAELVHLPADVIVTRGTPAAQAAKTATETIPIVMAAIGEPLGVGVVAQLGRPGSNVTGFSAYARELAAKRMELMKEASPALVRYGFLANMRNPAAPPAWEAMKAAGITLGLSTQLLDVHNKEDIANAFAIADREKIGAMFVGLDTVMQANAKTVVDLAREHKVLSAHQSREFVDLGGFLSYGPSFPDLYYRAAGLIDRIFKGAKAGDLPVEQPTKLELVINLKTAKALGLTVPQSLLARADEVIE
jgi:putative tryptophan/tyrosine transport system substrate-binding protein